MSYPPFVSVVVPVFNGEATIETCLRSLLAQDYESFEVIVVDNESTDGTAAVLEGFADRATVLREARRGAAAARNRGIREARGDVVAFTDGDCVADPGWLRAVVAPLENEEVGIAGGRVLAARPCNRVEKFGEVIHDQEMAICVYKPPYVVSSNWASRRSVLQDAGLFDDEFLRSQDVELAYRIVQLGYRLVYAPEAVVYHRNQRTLAGLFREGFTHGFHSFRVVAKHGRFLDEYGYRPFKLRSYRAIARHARDYVIRRDPDRALCACVFNAGKEVGKLAGFVRMR
jgi:glycosyltransferase involved in cell wall biosynthesis